MSTRNLLGVAALFAFLASRSAGAQERDPAPNPPSAPPPRRFFDRPIDYWQQGISLDRPRSRPAPAVPPSASNSAPQPGPSDWGRRVRQADGTFATEELPRPLVQVLEDPSPEHLRAYFEWKLARARKILRAAEALKAFRASGLVPPEAELLETPVRPPEALPESEKIPQPLTSQNASGLGGKPPFTLLYFHRKGCGPCEQEDRILRSWLADKPEGALSTLEFGAEPERWREFRVRGTPSLVLQTRSSGRSLFLEGLQSAADLDRALAESARTLGTPEDFKKGATP